MTPLPSLMVLASIRASSKPPPRRAPSWVPPLEPARPASAYWTPVMTSSVDPVATAPWQVLQRAISSTALMRNGPWAVCARWHPAQPSALSPREPMFTSLTWGPPSARAGTAARISQRAPHVIMSASRRTVPTSFLAIGCCGWAVPALPAIVVCVCGLPCSIAGTSVAPYLDAVVGRVGHVDAPAVVDRDSHWEGELAVRNAVAAEEAPVLRLLLVVGERRVDEDALGARIDDEDPARVVDRDTARQPKVAAPCAAPDLRDERSAGVEHQQA